MAKINLSAIVVGFNESALLDNCLSSISFCNEILYFDLGSADNSMEIARRHGAVVHQHERVLSCEWIHSKFAGDTKNEWVLIIDPDEVVDPQLAAQITTLFTNNEIPSTIGALTVPWKFYFKHKRLNGTPWGGNNTRVLIANNTRFIFTPEIHVGRKLKPGFELMEIPENNNNVVHHYWMRDFSALLSKHKRYLENEGQARYNNGHRSSLLRILYTPLTQFYFSFFTRKGYKDYMMGFLLSLFWSWYQASAQVRVYKFQKAITRS